MTLGTYLNFCNGSFSTFFNRAESKKIFVGGLPTEVTEKEFADYFGTFGLVKVTKQVSYRLQRTESDSLTAHPLHRMWLSWWIEPPTGREASAS
jgi:RNA recognition motif-containing protein